MDIVRTVNRHIMCLMENACHAQKAVSHVTCIGAHRVNHINGDLQQTAIMTAQQIVLIGNVRKTVDIVPDV